MSVPGPQQVLELAKVGRTFGEGATAVAALRGVDLTICAGEFVAVMGPSGSGKSSLLAVAGGLDRPTSGAVFVESTPLAGLNLNELARLRRRAVGYVFQDFNLVPTLTAAENVALPLELDGTSGRKAHRQAADALRQV
ncbi:MAG: ABC transporter ATP-binding protein, partial [Arthrobacter sp.]